MLRWLSDPTAPAWVQAVGSILAILVSVFVPWLQGKAARSREERLHLQRLVTGLREEIRATSEAADRRLTAISDTFGQLNKAMSAGVKINESAPNRPGSLTLTEAIIYTAVASELGRLPADLIQSVVKFYSLTLDTVRTADSAPTAIEAWKAILPSLPRVKAYAGIVIRMLDKLAAAGFRRNADLRLTPEEVRGVAATAGYPLDEVLKERGIVLPN